jgi:uncharacterized protein (TIGR03067 family)
MKRFAIASVFLAFVATLALAQQPDDSVKEILGEYSLKTGFKGGKEISNEEKNRFEKMEIKKDTITIFEKGRADPAKFTLDATKTPKQITIMPEMTDIKVLGIYKLEKDELTMVFTIGETRPTDFAGKEQTEMKLVLQKKESDKKDPPKENEKK